MGRISAGNKTLRIRLPPAIRTFADSSNDEENHVQGRMPQNRKSEKCSIPALRAAGITDVKTNV